MILKKPSDSAVKPAEIPEGTVFLKALILPSISGQEHAVVVLFPPDWADEDAETLASEISQKVDDLDGPDEQGGGFEFGLDWWSEFEARMKLAGFLFPAWTVNAESCWD